MILYDLHPEAKIGNNVKISNFTTIYEDVVIDDNTWIGPNVTIFPGARIGKNCKIFPGSVISAIPQDLKFNGEYTTCEIGDNNVIRECCTINRGTSASGKTVIGDNNLIMAYVHIAHDCVVGSNCVFANNTTLAGHIIVGDWAVLGGKTAILQFVHIGSHVITMGGSLVNKDIPPFVKTGPGYPVCYAGVNSIGLMRRGFSRERINAIQDVYRVIYSVGMNVTQSVQYIRENLPVSEDRDFILDFVESSKIGIMKNAVGNED
jgi:UDP-N-acetylglucosamine acyltransferase